MASCEKFAVQLDASVTLTGKDSPLCQHNRGLAPYGCLVDAVGIVVRSHLKMVNAWAILNAILVSVVKPSVVKMLVSAIKGLVPSAQNLKPCNLAPTYPVSCPPRQVPHPPYSDWELNRKVE